MLTFDLAGGRKTQHREWLKKLRAEGEVEKDVLERPEILPEAAEFWEAFMILSVQRHFNDGNPQPILLSEINAYSQIVDVVERQFLLRIVLTLDALYIQHHSNKAAQKERERKRGNLDGGRSKNRNRR